MKNTTVAAFRLLAFVVLTVCAVVPYAILVLAGWRRHSVYASAYWRIAAFILGFRVVVHGTPAAGRPVLFVANHVSYFDVVVLGSLLPACFVAKAEVAGWPGLGLMSRIARTAFVERRRGSTARERDQLKGRLDGGEQLVLFPEGTSSDGNRVLPFKSSLFAMAEGGVCSPGAPPEPLPVQPVSLAYTRLDGLPMQRAFRPFFAWYGDMTFVGHALEALGVGLVTVEVIFHEVVTIAQFPDRKALAHHCHDVVHRGLTRALAGRLG